MYRVQPLSWTNRSNGRTNIWWWNMLSRHLYSVKRYQNHMNMVLHRRPTQWNHQMNKWMNEWMEERTRIKGKKMEKDRAEKNEKKNCIWMSGLFLVGRVCVSEIQKQLRFLLDSYQFAFTLSKLWFSFSFEISVLFLLFVVLSFIFVKRFN